MDSMSKTNFKFTSYKSKVEKELDQVAVRAMTIILEIIKSAIKSNASTHTGMLKNSIDYKLKEMNGQVIGIVGSPLMYAIYVEFGTGEFATNGAGRKGGWAYQDSSGEWFFTWGQKPDPFMQKAFRENKQQIIDILGKEFSASFQGG